MSANHCAAIAVTRTSLAVSAAALCLNGCQVLDAYKGYAANPLDLSGTSTVYERISDQIKKRTPGIKPCFADEYRSTSGVADTCLAQRNHVISYLMAESGALCVVHLSEIYGKEAGFNIATGSIAALTSGIASVSAGTQAKTLAAISSLASSERALVNESVYKNLLTTAIATKIEQSRATLGKALLVKKTQSYSGYRIEDAVFDVIDYHHACSFYKGMELALAEGTNTNPTSKLATLETKAQALAQQIDTRAAALKMDDAARKLLLDSKGSASTGDPVLKGLVERFQAVQQEILTATQTPAPAPKKDSGGLGEAGVPSLDLGSDDVANPLAGLVAADASVKKAAGEVANAVKLQATNVTTTLKEDYLKAVGKAAAEFAKSFHDEFLGSGKVGDPAKGMIATKLKAFRDVQDKYVVEKSGLDLSALADMQKEVDLAADVKKAALELAVLQQKVNNCEGEAKKRIDAFKKGEVDEVKTKSSDAAKFDKLQGSAPSWTGSQTAACLK